MQTYYVYGYVAWEIASERKICTPWEEKFAFRERGKFCAREKSFDHKPQKQYDNNKEPFKIGACEMH